MIKSNMVLNQIFNEDCRKTMKDRILEHSIDVILTSPFYNTNVKATGGQTLVNCADSANRTNSVRYDEFVDVMSKEEYTEFTVDLFRLFDRVLKNNGCVLYNISYGSENTDGMFLAIAEVIKRTNFTLADTIVWKKKNAIPNNTSSNKLTRITEFVFVFCRKDEFHSFHSNKKVVTIGVKGQKRYENIFNYIEAPNNDGKCPYNRATFSVSLVEQLLRIYCPKNGIVYDPFMGSGTTAVAAITNGYNYLGSEISKNQVQWSCERLKNLKSNVAEFFVEE